MTFFVLEGIDGSGKTTQSRMLVDRLREDGLKIASFFEPGSTPVGEAVRNILMTTPNLAYEAEALLFTAARAQLVQQCINPALDEGKIVVCDRYVESTYAYQGYGRFLHRDELSVLNDLATYGLEPNLTIYIDLVPEIGLERRRLSGKIDRWDSESLDFYKRVRRGYLEAYGKAKKDRWLLVDGDQPAEDIHESIYLYAKKVIENDRTTV